MKIASIFSTVDGEVTYRGPWYWTVFVRTGGCNLRCWKSSGFCDAPHTLDMNFPYPEMTPNEVVHDVLKFGNIRRCTITGGEPLLQMEEVHQLAAQLDVDNGWDVTLETSGSIAFKRRQDLLHVTSIIMDLKPPSTEMEKKNVLTNLDQLDNIDFVKVVIEDRADYEWALQTLPPLRTRAKLAFGVRWGYLDLSLVAAWLRQDQRFDVMLNLQSHKMIWPNTHPNPVPSLKEVDFLDMVKKEH